MKVIGVRSRENKRYGCTGSEYRQLCDVYSQKRKKKAGGVILEGTMGQRRYTHTYRYIYIKMGGSTPCFCVKVNYLGETIDKEIGEQFQEQSLVKSKRDHGAKWRGQKHYNQVIGEKAESGQRGR